MVALIFYMFVLGIIGLIEINTGVTFECVNLAFMMGLPIILIIDIIVTVYCQNHKRDVGKYTYPIVKSNESYYLESDDKYVILYLYRYGETSKTNIQICDKDKVEIKHGNNETFTAIMRESIYSQWMKLFLLIPLWPEYRFVIEIPETITQ